MDENKFQTGVFMLLLLIVICLGFAFYQLEQ